MVPSKPSLPKAEKRHLMDQNQFNEYIIKHDIIGFFDSAIKLKSGRSSHFYVNWRKATNDAFLLDQLTDFIVSFLEASQVTFDSIYGVPEGASKIGVVTALKWAKKQQDFEIGKYTIPMGRAKPKEHGKPEDKFFIGHPQGKTLVIEDTITTGLSLIDTLDKLTSSGIDVVAAVGLTDRMEKRDDGSSVKEAIEKKFSGKIQYLTMSKATQLLGTAAKKANIQKSILDHVEREFSEVGVEPVQL